ncbi:hypothetical protein [Puniceibacterium sediminis]|uniref:Uncharacterized protein n=1 Tax=Puniceibacterium sediminis TaxID=1608407 RepID=A0A238XEJ9_9RHOB|nr:hypothetical protein [Puniceibacterium sediminis]SNR57038.1 hypothetical protein SAMN06265370_110154 [Puniceibacterium sediminis]
MNGYAVGFCLFQQRLGTVRILCWNFQCDTCPQCRRHGHVRGDLRIRGDQRPKEGFAVNGHVQGATDPHVIQRNETAVVAQVVVSELG